MGDPVPLIKLALVVEYEGSQYHGFQAQVNAPTIQGEIERALKALTGETLRIAGASRTDAGVHAQGQVISFRTGSALPVEAFVKGLNYYLPCDIAVKAGFKVEDIFAARRGALSREYRYIILNRATPSPLARRFAYLVRQPLNVEAMKEACQYLVGEHDFAPFSGPLERKSMRTVRKVYKAELKKEGELITLDMVADSFLPQQVRRMVGALVRVGLGKTSVEEFRRLARSKIHGLASFTAPPHGLCLVRVNYPDFGLSQG